MSNDCELIFIPGTLAANNVLKHDHFRLQHFSLVAIQEKVPREPRSADDAESEVLV